MTAATARERFADLPVKKATAPYNFTRFRLRHFIEDAVHTARAHGIQAGEQAPDFELPAAGGGTRKLSELRGKPVLLHFGSFT